MGIGIEIMTYIADHYRPPTLRAALGVFGRPNVIRRADFVIFIGGGHGTLDEVDLAISMRKKIVPFAASGGAARHAFERLDADVSLRDWMPEAMFAALGCCASADEYANVLEQVLADTGSAP
jgi:predicted Rossmann-fold nucleotide-binding protein